MSTETIKSMLRQIHAELETTEDLPESEEATLRSLLDDIEGRLDELEDHDHDDGFGDRFNNAIGDFQASHPTLASTLRQLVDTLQKMGI